MASYMTAAEQITMKANQVSDESLESTRRMLQMAEESKQTAATTMVMLDQQGEQLRRVEGVTDKIAKDMTQAEKNLKELTKWKLKWRFKQWLKRAWGSGAEGGNAVEGGGTMTSKQASGVPGNQSTHLNLSSLSGPYIKRITNDRREDEMEENLVAVGGILGNLRAMAIDMGSEIDKQNEQIGHITGVVDVNKARIDQVNQSANRLIR